MTTSAGLLLHRRSPAADVPEVFLAHMGGPFWAKKDAGAWSIPKGEFDPAVEDPRDAARREFVEELGVQPPIGAWVDLGEVRYSSGKRLIAFALTADGWSPGPFAFGEFELEWPPRSGRRRSFPEVDRAEWMPLPLAVQRLVSAQRALLDRL